MISRWKKGDPLSSEKRGPIQRSDLVSYAEASGDHNRIHLDEEFAKASGFPSVIVHGMLSMGFLGDYLLQFFPEDRFKITQFKARFRKVTFPGDTLDCQGEVRDVEGDKVVVHLRTVNEKGEVTTDGEVELHALSSN
jgi:acyl dehydratase